MANIPFIPDKARTDANLSVGLALGLTLFFIFSSARSNFSAEIITTDGNLVRESTGVIYDTDTGLEWYPGPDQGMNWEDAHDWVTGLEALGGGWRMPRRAELDALYRIGDGVRNLTPLVAFSGYWIWTGKKQEASAKWMFNFSYGGEGWSGQAPADGGRAIAVRIRQEYN